MSSASRSPATTSFTCDCCGDPFDYTPNTDHGSTNCITCVPIVKEILKEELIASGNRLYRGAYTYDKVKYVSECTDIDIYCTVCEDYFHMTPRAHVSVKGYCTMCKSRNYNTRNLKTFIENANRAHKDRYSYVKSVFKNISTPLVIICNQCTHEFSTSPTKHIANLKGCSICAAEDKITAAYEKFLEDAKNIFGDSYSYSDTEFVNMTTAITVTHNLCEYEFKVSPYAHINQKIGCPMCFSKEGIDGINSNVYFSYGEQVIYKYLDSMGWNFIHQHSFPDCIHKGVLIFDFYVPGKKLLIEYQGQQHYKHIKYFGTVEDFKSLLIRDKIKREYCKINGYNLLKIKYDEDPVTAINKYLKNEEEDNRI